MRLFSATVVALAFLLLAPCGARAQLRIEVTGAEQAVFVHARDACRPEDIPDAPARAFRDAHGLVHLFATHYINFGFVGSDLDTAKRDCRVVYQGAGDDNPAAFNDRAWLTSFWTNDGITVEALVHNEFQANLRPWLCPSRVYAECWYNAITMAVSTDEGLNFARPANAIVAAPAYRFDNTVGHPVGYFSPSNIVKLDGDYYTMVWAENVGTQHRGVCLLRTSDVARTDSWRAWDGGEFSVRLGNPYLEPANQPPHACEVIDPDHLHSHIESLVRHGATGHFIAVMAFEDGGFYVSDSADLFHWSEPQKIADTGQVTARECDNRALRAYPSRLDPRSGSRNFEVAGDTAYLYFTRFHFKNCAGTLDRDLMRVPVTIKAPS
jgi:hypothetical protein